MGTETGQPVATALDEEQAPRSARLEARLEALTAFVGGILFEVDRDGRYLGVWAGEPELLARPAHELRGKRVVDVIGPELGRTFVGAFAKVLDTGTPETIDYALDVPRGRRNFRCEVRLTPREGEGAGTVLLLVRDITDEMALRAKVVEAERLAAMGLVAASVGHEIRQPLAFATTSVEVLARELSTGAPSQRAREALDHVRDAVRRIASIAASVGVLAPDERSELSTDVRRPLEAAADLCASELQNRSLVMVIPELPRVRAREGELCQVVANLLLNAAQAIDLAHAPSNRIELEASLHKDGTKVQIEVRDQGRGIAPANFTRVFDPFFTTKEKGRGTGLGLFVSRRIAEEAGGALEIESKLGVGTTIRLTLPIADAESVQVVEAPAPAPERITVLVIDDEPAFLRSLQLVLEDTHEVVICSRSAEALALVRAEPTRYDAILCDLSMPEIDGAAFYGHMQALGLTDRFILMTAGAFTPRGEDFLRHTRCARIGKPFAMDKLLSVLASVTGRQR